MKKKLFSYAICLLVGILLGFIVHAKFICEDGMVVKKAKIKGRNNTIENLINKK